MSTQRGAQLLQLVGGKPFTLSRGHLMSTIDLAEDFEIAFDFKRMGMGDAGGWSNILHFIASNPAKACVEMIGMSVETQASSDVPPYKEIVFGLWFNHASTQIAYFFGANDERSFKQMHRTLPDYGDDGYSEADWRSQRFVVSGEKLTVYVDGKEVHSSRIGTRDILSNVRVYASSPLHNAANYRIRNFYVKGATESKQILNDDDPATSKPTVELVGTKPLNLQRGTHIGTLDLDSDFEVSVDIKRMSCAGGWCNILHLMAIETSDASLEVKDFNFEMSEGLDCPPYKDLVFGLWVHHAALELSLYIGAIDTPSFHHMALRLMAYGEDGYAEAEWRSHRFVITGNRLVVFIDGMPAHTRMIGPRSCLSGVRVFASNPFQNAADFKIRNLTITVPETQQEGQKSSGSAQAELMGMSLKSLKQRAKSEGVPQDAIEDIDDAEHPKQTAIKLIIDQIEKNSDLEVNQRAELSKLSLKDLKRLARDENIKSELIENVDDEEQPKTAVIALVLAHRKQKLDASKEKGTAASKEKDTDASKEVVQGRMKPVAESSVEILPYTKWEDIRPEWSFLEELAENPGIHHVVPDIEVIVSDIKKKMAGIASNDSVKDLLKKMDDDDIAAVLAYTHDFGTGEKNGNLYYELNNALRRRDETGRKELMRTWGVSVHYILKGFSKLPTHEGVLYRGLDERSEIVKQYKLKRPIQWGSFTSTTTSLKSAKGFSDKKSGVIVKIKGGFGKVVGPLSFFRGENEVILSPNAQFTVTEEPEEKDGWWYVEIMQMSDEKAYVF